MQEKKRPKIQAYWSLIFLNVPKLYVNAKIGLKDL